MSLSARTRFEVFKRDDFTCRYCGRKSPETVLEVDHIVPRVEGGSDDPFNLATSCWECNRGKGPIPLSQVMTGEDPHDSAILVLEKRRQLEEYNFVLEMDRLAREKDAVDLAEHWLEVSRKRWVNEEDKYWLQATLRHCPKAVVWELMDYAAARRKTSNMAFLNACVQGWRRRAGT